VCGAFEDPPAEHAGSSQLTRPVSRQPWRRLAPAALAPPAVLDPGGFEPDCGFGVWKASPPRGVLLPGLPVPCCILPDFAGRSENCQERRWERVEEEKGWRRGGKAKEARLNRLNGHRVQEKEGKAFAVGKARQRPLRATPKQNVFRPSVVCQRAPLPPLPAPRPLIVATGSRTANPAKGERARPSGNARRQRSRR